VAFANHEIEFQPFNARVFSKSCTFEGNLNLKMATTPYQLTALYDEGYAVAELLQITNINKTK
jgi:hypothetical protein